MHFHFVILWFHVNAVVEITGTILLDIFLKQHSITKYSLINGDSLLNNNSFLQYFYKYKSLHLPESCSSCPSSWSWRTSVRWFYQFFLLPCRGRLMQCMSQFYQLPHWRKQYSFFFKTYLQFKSVRFVLNMIKRLLNIEIFIQGKLQCTWMFKMNITRLNNWYDK